MEKKNNLPIMQVADKMNGVVSSVLGATAINGFEKAYLTADAIGQLKTMLTSDYMKPIMELQNNRLGFKTDKEGKYPEEVVKNCLIEAVLMGVQPHGNQFNIIAGNCYITKEGFGYLLNKIVGLKYQIVFELPRINADKSGAAITAIITWKLNGEDNEQKLDIPVKMNSYMGTDAVIGKATRKARAWLFNNISGTEIADGDTTDAEATVIETKLNKAEASKQASEAFKVSVDKNGQQTIS